VPLYNQSGKNPIKYHPVRILLTLIAFCLLHSIDAQTSCPKSTNKKAVSYFQDATDAFKDRKYEDAKELLSKAIDADPEFADAYLLQGNIAFKKKDDKTMEESYKKVIELCPDLDPEVYFQLGWLYYDLQKWKDSEKQLKAFLDFDKINEEHAKRAETMLVRSKLMAHPVPFNPVPIKDISTADPEYLPYISPDNTMAFFTRRFEMKEKNMLVAQSVEKFMVAKLKSPGVYDQGHPMEAPFNSGMSNNEGGATITLDNKHLFFTVNQKGNFDICTSDFVDGYWTEIKNLGPKVNDPKQWDSQPSITSDAKTLFFASSRDSLTGIDIYKTTKDENGEWKKAVKLPPMINTNGNEKSPFMHSDSRTLYFSSDSLPGLGGFDIFKCQMDSNGNWTKPVNLGYPINTDADEVGFFVSLDGKTGYFASNKLNGGRNGFDIYSFDLYQEARPNIVYFQKGDLKENDETPIAAQIEVKDAVTKKLTTIDVDSVTGEYAFVVDFTNDLILSVKKEGYAFESKYISKNDTTNLQPKIVDMDMKRLEVGAQYTINDILFSTNSFEINDTIKAVLDEFIDYLKQNPGLRVALQGHTDNVGNPQANMVLSENRAKAVFNYLTSHSISNARITYKGYGETKPIADNNTEEGRAKNRRTVFVVTSK
jgi:outer membrane protein OmpA-like peptidoglycan-associated protein